VASIGDVALGVKEEGIGIGFKIKILGALSVVGVLQYSPLPLAL
jgi:hypothetical protein